MIGPGARRLSWVNTDLPKRTTRWNIEDFETARFEAALAKMIARQRHAAGHCTERRAAVTPSADSATRADIQLIVRFARAILGEAHPASGRLRARSFRNGAPGEPCGRCSISYVAHDDRRSRLHSSRRSAESPTS